MSFAERIAAELTTENVNFVPFEQLIEGWHPVKVSLVVITDDLHVGLRNPQPKAEDKRPIWTDPTPQIGVYFQNELNHGCARRFSIFGYKKYDDLLKADPAEAATCTKEGVQGYAVDKKDKVRLIDEENTRQSRMILKRMCTAAGVPEGVNGLDLPSALHGKELMIQVTSHEFEGKKYYDVQNFAPIGTPASDLARIPTPSGVITALPATEI